MSRAPFQVLVLPFRRGSSGEIEFAIFRRAVGGYWQGIAGGGEEGETPAQAARREAFEEAGIPATSLFYTLSTTTTVPAYYFSDGQHWSANTYVVPEHTFAADCEGIELVLSNEHTEVRWVTGKDAQEILRYDSNKCAVWELEQRLRRHDMPAAGPVGYNAPMISEEDKRIVRETAAKYGAKRVVLFGSSLSADKESRDIDLGVEGIAHEDFFAFYGELLCTLSKPVDVIDLSTKSRFVEIVEREGVPL